MYITGKIYKTVEDCLADEKEIERRKEEQKAKEREYKRRKEEAEQEAREVLVKAFKNYCDVTGIGIEDAALILGLCAITEELGE